jgi:hypothetical protein
MMKVTLALELLIKAESGRGQYGTPGGRCGGRAVKTGPEFVHWVAN